jgi:O-antigen/teichoic acid export membrane protein
MPLSESAKISAYDEVTNPAEVKTAITIAKTTSVVLLGSIATMFFSFIQNILLVRSLSQTDFGTLSLALTILTIVVLLFSAGFTESLPRYISLFKTQHDQNGIAAIILFSLRWPLLVGFSLTVVTIIFASNIADLLGIPGNGFSVGFLAITIPCSLCVLFMSSILRSFGDAVGQAIFNNLLTGGSKLLLLLLVFLLGASYSFVLGALVIAALISTVGLMIYTWKKHMREAIRYKPKPISWELLKFNFPIAIHVFTLSLNDWVSLPILGIFHTPTQVALFSVAKSTANYTSILLYASVFFFLPAATSAISAGNIKLFSSIYQTITKWIFLISFPVMLVLLTVPQAALSLLYKSQYASADVSLQILIAGYMIAVLTGPNGHGLIALGRNKDIAICSTIGIGFGVVFYFALIPGLGAVGAALAFVASQLITNILLSGRLFQLTRLQPFSIGLVKTLFISVILCSLIAWAFKALFNDAVWIVGPLFAIFLLVVLLSLVLTNSVTEADITLIQAVERKLRVKPALSKVLIQVKA